jgi:transposase
VRSFGVGVRHRGAAAVVQIKAEGQPYDVPAIHRRRRATEFKKFLIKLDTQVPTDLDVHLICDNYATHKSPPIAKWLAAHPLFHTHFTPTYSSGLNQVERGFALLTDKQLRRGVHPEVRPLFWRLLILVHWIREGVDDGTAEQVPAGVRGARGAAVSGFGGPHHRGGGPRVGGRCGDLPQVGAPGRGGPGSGSGEADLGAVGGVVAAHAENAELRRTNEILRLASSFFAHEADPTRRRRRRERFVQAHREEFGVVRLCRVLGIAVSTFYDRVGRPAWACALADAELAEKIEKIWADSGRSYGSPGIHAALARAGIRVGCKRVERIMAANGWRGGHLRRGWKTTTSGESRRRRCRIWCAVISLRMGLITVGR